MLLSWFVLKIFICIPFPNEKMLLHWKIFLYLLLHLQMQFCHSYQNYIIHIFSCYVLNINFLVLIAEQKNSAILTEKTRYFIHCFWPSCKVQQNSVCIAFLKEKMFASSSWKAKLLISSQNVKSLLKLLAFRKRKIVSLRDLTFLLLSNEIDLLTLVRILLKIVHMQHFKVPKVIKGFCLVSILSKNLKPFNVAKSLTDIYIFQKKRSFPETCKMA